MAHKKIEELNVWHKILIVNAIKDSHGIEEWQDEMMWKKDWQDYRIAREVVDMLEEEILDDKISGLECQLKTLKYERDKEKMGWKK